jgi:hypothetical protein
MFDGLKQTYMKEGNLGLDYSLKELHAFLILVSQRHLPLDVFLYFHTSILYN